MATSTDVKRISYDSETCTRCGGSGHYSYNRVDGTTCFKCKGSGAQLTPRGKAALAFADSLLNRKIEELAGEDRFQYLDAIRGRRYSGCTAVEVASFSHRADGTPVPAFEVRSSSGKVVVVTSAGTKVRLHPTPEQMDQIIAYQDSLTKAGKPRKRAK